MCELSVAQAGLNIAANGSTCVTWPCTTLEADDRAGSSADSEQDREHLRPAARERAPDGVASAQMHPFRDQHHERQADSEHGEEQVKAQRGANLRATSREVADGGEWE
jgi:hypothetical protein